MNNDALWNAMWIGFWLGTVLSIATSVARRWLPGYDRDGFFAIHPSLTALWRTGYNEKGERFDGKPAPPYWQFLK